MRHIGHSQVFRESAIGRRLDDEHGLIESEAMTKRKLQDETWERDYVEEL